MNFLWLFNPYKKYIEYFPPLFSQKYYQLILLIYNLLYQDYKQQLMIIIGLCLEISFHLRSSNYNNQYKIIHYQKLFIWIKNFRQICDYI